MMETLGDDAVDGFGREFLDELGRATTPKLIRTNLRIAQYQSASGYDRPRLDMNAVQHRGSHANQDVALDVGAMHTGIVTDGDIVGYLNIAIAQRGMETGAILHVDTIAQLDIIDIATQHGTIPDAAPLAHLHLTDDGGGFGDETVFPNLRFYSLK